MPSIKDVAKLAGVSPMTASRAINESGQVSMKMKLRVMRAVKQLGYRPNFNARSLRVQKSPRSPSMWKSLRTTTATTSWSAPHGRTGAGKRNISKL